MAQYRAKPVVVTAHRIIAIVDLDITEPGRRLALSLDNGDVMKADHGMTARYSPVKGDYVVVQEDGYTYLNPKDVFEHKYEAQPAAAATAATDTDNSAKPDAIVADWGVR